MSSASRITVNSGASNVVIGLALIPGLVVLAAAFHFFETGQILFGVAAGAAFIGLMMPAGLWARRLGTQIEVDDAAIRQVHRSGRVVEIRWDEPHEMQHSTKIIRRMGLPLTRHTTVKITAAGRTIRFSAQSGGAVGAAARASGTTDLVAAGDVVARAIALSEAARRPRARGAA